MAAAQRRLGAGSNADCLLLVLTGTPLVQVENEYGFAAAASRTCGTWWPSGSITCLKRLQTLFDQLLMLSSVSSVQVENEYGFCGSSKPYLRHLVATARQHLGNDTILYTTDPPAITPKGSLYGDDVYTCVSRDSCKHASQLLTNLSCWVGIFGFACAGDAWELADGNIV